MVTWQFHCSRLYLELWKLAVLCGNLCIVVTLTVRPSR